MIFIRYDHEDNTFEYYCDNAGEADFLHTQIQCLNARYLDGNEYSSANSYHFVNRVGEYESNGWIESELRIVNEIVSTLKDFDFSVELKELE